MATEVDGWWGKIQSPDNRKTIEAASRWSRLPIHTTALESDSPSNDRSGSQGKECYILCLNFQYLFLLCGSPYGAALSAVPRPCVRPFHASDFLETEKS